MSWRVILFGLTKRIDEIGDKFFGFGVGEKSFFFAFYDDFVICDFENFFARDGEFGVDEAFENWTFDDELPDDKIV